MNARTMIRKILELTMSENETVIVNVTDSEGVYLFDAEIKDVKLDSMNGGPYIVLIAEGGAD